MAAVDVHQLRTKVKEMYKAVAQEPDGTFHFEMGRELALRLGYPGDELDRIPPEAIESFAGVGYHLGLASLLPGDRVLDLGSGSGTDAFVAALAVTETGDVTGVDMTDAQLEKARYLAGRDGFSDVRFEEGYIENIRIESSSMDIVISNGVINLCADKASVFSEIARVLKPGGRMAISDIVTKKPLTEAIVCDVNLWASCIGGARQQDDYQGDIEGAGLQIAELRDNPEYYFKSVSVLAIKQ
jgi:SAM-dependent methyltransferase